MLRTQHDFALENLALRQQLAVFKQSRPRPRLTDADRTFWILVSKIWHGWRSTLHIVQPETVVRWHRQGFRYYWRRKSRRLGRPKIDPEIVCLIRRMCRANPLWGALRIHGELLKLGIDESPRFLIRDRDAIYGEAFHRQARALRIEQVPTAPRSPWQNPYAERVIGSIRRECLNHTIVLGERRLMRILSSYAAYYNDTRTHLSLSKDSPDHRATHPPQRGEVVELDRVGGLHHEYVRMAA